MGKIADTIALILACTTANDASVNYSMYVPQRPSKAPIAPMGLSDVLRLCLQGGAVGVQSGSVTFSSCTITGNTATGFVCAHVRKFPSPRLENALLTYPNRFSSFMIDLPVSSTCHLRLKLQKFPTPDGKTADALASCFALVLAGWRCRCYGWHGDLLIVHHHWQLSLQCACSRSKFPTAPMGKWLTCLP